MQTQKKSCSTKRYRPIAERWGLRKTDSKAELHLKSDLAQARTQLEDAQVLDTDTMVQRAEYEHAIAILIGKPPANFSLPPSPIDLHTPAIPAIPEVLPSELLERRPDIAASERRMGAANEQIGIAQAAYYPTLNLSALAGFEGTSATNWLNWPRPLLGSWSQPF